MKKSSFYTKIISIFVLLTFILTSNTYSLISAETLRPKMLFNKEDNVIDYSDKLCVTDLKDDDIKGKVILLSADLNVGKTSGELKPEALMRIRAIEEDLTYLLERFVEAIIMSHNGSKKNYKDNLKNGNVDPDYSLKPIANTLTGLLINEPLFRGKSVLFVEDCIGEKTKSIIEKAGRGSIILTEQTRFHKAETSNNPNEVRIFAKKLQDTVNADVFVNAGAGALHRDNVSKGPVADLIKGPKALGILSKKELGAMQKIANDPKRKVVGIFGGAKLDGGKLEAIKKLIELKAVDRVVIVGKMALPFTRGEETAEGIREMAKKTI